MTISFPLSQLLYWHWFALGLFLLILELILSSSGFLLWLGIASTINGIIILIFPQLFWGYQAFIFGILSLLSVILWFNLIRYSKNTEEPILNQRNRQYIGRIFTLTEPIINNRGTIRVDDSSWRVMGEDMPAGTKVKVVGADGVILMVERIENN